MLRPVLQPVAPVHDFQDWDAWRELVAATINALTTDLPKNGPRMVIVPQTITNEGYWSQILSRLNPAFTVTPVALYVDREEHRRRATNDADEPGALRWRLGKFDHFDSAKWIHTRFTGIDTTSLDRDHTVAAVASLIKEHG